MRTFPPVRLRWFVWAIALMLVAPFPSLARQTPTTEAPGVAGFMGTRGTAFSSGENAFYAAIDAFWSASLDDAGLGVTYRPPRNVFVVTDEARSECGSVATTERNAFYCGLDESIYITQAMIDWASDPAQDFGDYGPFNILAHEWAHHVQFQLGIMDGSGNTVELQADCMAGAWAQRARTLGMLDKGDVTEAALLSAASGDDYGMPQDIEGAHGIDDDRITKFMGGYINGIAECDLPLTTSVQSEGKGTSGGMAGGSDPTADQGQDQDGNGPLLDKGARAALPTAPALAHADCFFVYDEATLDFPGLVGRFADVPDAASRLAALGWQDGAFRQFGCHGPPAGTAGWIDVSIHVFADAPAAQAAVPYFATTRIAGTTLRYADAPLLGDATTAVTGPASNGWEYTLYASEGPALVRVTGVAPAGDPKADVATVMADVLARLGGNAAGPALVTPTAIVAPTAVPVESVLGLLPDRLAIANASCFVPIGDWRFTNEEVVPWLGRAGAPAQLVDAWRWQDGANRTLRCAAPDAGGASQFDVTVHRFGDFVAARAAEPYALRAYATGPDEARSCGTAGDVVACVTGQGVAGPPKAEVETVLRQVLAGA